MKERLPEIELVNIILGSEIEYIRKDFNDIKAFFATNDKPSNNQHQTTTKRPTSLNTNNDQQQEGSIIIGNAINPGEDNNSNTTQTLRKKRTTTLKSLDSNIQNTPVNDNRKSDKETNTETNEFTDTTTDYNDATEPPNVTSEPPQITTESTIQETVTPETDTESYMTDTDVLTELPDTNEETTDNQETDTETTDDQDTNNETTVDPNTNDELTEFTTDAQTTNGPVDTTTELELTTITEIPLTNFPDHSDNKEIGIETTETPSIHTDINTETSHIQTNTTAIPTETNTQNSLTNLPGTSVNILDFIANQLSKNKTLNPDLETTRLEGQKIRLKPKKKVRNNDRMRLTPWRIIDHTLTTKEPRVTARPQSDLTSNTIKIDDKFTNKRNQDTHHEIVKRQVTRLDLGEELL